MALITTVPGWKAAYVTASGRFQEILIRATDVTGMFGGWSSTTHDLLL